MELIVLSKFDYSFSVQIVHKDLYPLKPKLKIEEK